MIGLVNYSSEPLSVELRELRRPEVGDADVLLEVGAVAICGSDVHQWMSKHSWPVNYPVVLGHEFGGTIVEVGRGAAEFSPGDRVVSETAAVINPQSPLTRRGLYNLDPDRKGFGYGVDGAMAQFVRVPARCLHRIPEHLPFDQAALTEPCCVAYNTVIRNSDIRAGDRVAVIGPGPIGLLCAVMAQLAGADVALVGLERDRGRLCVAERYGLTTVEGDVSDWAFQADGLGVHGVVDAAGVSQTLKTALQVVRPAGWITKVGWGREPLDFSLDPLVQKNITLRGSFSHTWEIWEAVIGLLGSGGLSVEHIVGGIWPLEEWKTGFEQMHSGQILKAVLHP